jgi:hypothetical protein
MDATGRSPSDASVRMSRSLRGSPCTASHRATTGFAMS